MPIARSSNMFHGFRVFTCFFYLSPEPYVRTKIHLKWTKSYCSFQPVLKTLLTDGSSKIMKLETPVFKSCLTPTVLAIKDLFAKNGHEVRIVGGAVRDLLLDVKPKDLDFATTMLPQEMKEMFEKNCIRMININGEKHGTISVFVDETPFEFTTLRLDKLTDGRHAEVEFTKNWKLDANRRDLTINAMYLDFDGNLYDYFNGYEDLKNRRIVFVGDTEQRIREDYLRILRYFRFYGRIANVPDNHDKDVIKVIKENMHGLKQISKERIWTELYKILSGRFAGELLQKMISLNIGPFIGFPEKCNEIELKKITDRLKMNDLKVDPVTLLISVFHNEDDFSQFCDAIKPSTAQKDLGFYLLQHRHAVIGSNPLKFYELSLLEKSKMIKCIRKTYAQELFKYRGEIKLLEEFENSESPKFPINGHMLKEKGIIGKDLTKILLTLKRIWIENDFNVSPEELLEKIPEIVNENGQKRQKTKY